MNNTSTSSPSTCHKCGGYLNLPSFWHGTIPPRMCTCPTQYANNSGWICPRCNKVNAPFRVTCDCMPTDPLKVT